jgi:hypothetical protein
MTWELIFHYINIHANKQNFYSKYLMVNDDDNDRARLFNNTNRTYITDGNLGKS